MNSASIPKRTQYFSPRTRWAIVACLALAVGVAILLIESNLPEYLHKAGFFLLGICGAIFANSTGAGGGVVFIPTFHQLGFSEAQSVATSFGIQCFGMTAGAITWFLHFRRQPANHAHHWQSFLPVIGLATLFSVIGIWHNYGMQLPPPAALQQVFSIFSICLGISILATIYLLKPGETRMRMTVLDVIMLIVIAYSGGVITAWLSVGVGEMVAFYLILRRFDVTMAIAAAVVISALTVWSAAPYHFAINPKVDWSVALFAGPGAVIGGVVARSIVSHLSARRLKIFFGVWVLIIGLASK